MERSTKTDNIPERVAIQCLDCSTELLLPLGRSGYVVCPQCKARGWFTTRTNSALRNRLEMLLRNQRGIGVTAAWLVAGAAFWLVLAACITGAHEMLICIVTAGSALSALAAGYVAKNAEKRNLLYGPIVELRSFFAILFFVSLGFSGLQLWRAYSCDPSATTSAIWQFERSFRRLRQQTFGLFQPNWGTAVALALMLFGLCVLRLQEARTKFFRRLSKARRWVSLASNVVTAVAAFTFGGTSADAQVLRMAVRLVDKLDAVEVLGAEQAAAAIDSIATEVSKDVIDGRSLRDLDDSVEPDAGADDGENRPNYSTADFSRSKRSSSDFSRARERVKEYRGWVAGQPTAKTSSKPAPSEETVEYIWARLRDAPPDAGHGSEVSKLEETTPPRAGSMSDELRQLIKELVKATLRNALPTASDFLKSHGGSDPLDEPIGKLIDALVSSPLGGLLQEIAMDTAEHASPRVGAAGLEETVRRLYRRLKSNAASKMKAGLDSISRYVEAVATEMRSQRASSIVKPDRAPRTRTRPLFGLSDRPTKPTDDWPPPDPNDRAPGDWRADEPTEGWPLPDPDNPAPEVGGRRPDVTDELPGHALTRDPRRGVYRR
jgi:hypothetical protein